MRPTCADCALKHIAQAAILHSEAHQGYPTHVFYAMGHMAEASDELVKEYPFYASLVRDERKRLEADFDYAPDWEGLLETIAEKCEICQLNPDIPTRGTGRVLGTAKDPTGVLDRLSESEREIRHNNPIAWTKCEIDYPSLQNKLLSCATQLTGVPGIESPIAVCRASIPCPPG